MKRFLLKLSYTILPLWLAAVGWYVYYNAFLLAGISGDLGRVGQIYFGPDYARYIDSFAQDSLFYEERSSTDSLVFEACGVLALGDSFSRRSRGCFLNALAGRGIRLQSYLPTQDFANLNPFSDAWHLLKDGYVDSSRANVMLVETVERSLLPRLLEMEGALTLGAGSARPATISPRPSDMQNGSWTLIQPVDYFRKFSGLVTTEVRHVRLQQDCFSHERYARDLFFFVEDVNSEMRIDTMLPLHRTAVENLSRLYQLAEERGVRLVLLVAPDKYDLYQTLVADNPFPPKTVNEDLRRLFPDSTKLVLGKELLLPRVVEGERDVYRLDDTHWSYRTADIVAEYLYRLLAPSDDCSSPPAKRNYIIYGLQGWQ